MEHPTRGLDIESAAWVWSQLLERRTDGTAIVFASADLDELLRYSDRIAVFFEGRIIEVVDAAATDCRGARPAHRRAAQVSRAQRPAWLGSASTAIVSVGIAFGVAVLLLLLVDAPPFEALRLLWDGSFGTLAKFSDTLMTWIPLVLAAAGLIVTFQAGLWNIGVEGQIVAGAIGATWIARSLGWPIGRR